VAVFNPGDVAPEQARALFDVPLGEFLLFAQFAKAVAYDHGGIIPLTRIEGKQQSWRAPRACYTVAAMAQQRLGQHFLADLQWREEIARAIRVSPHSTVPIPKNDQHCWIEIGAGHGEMTEHLLSTGAPVHAIEFDAPLFARLQRLAQKFPNLDAVHGDVLKADIGALAAGRRIFVYGNLPYFITSPILHHLFEFANAIDEIHIVIQTEVARRLAAEPGTRDYGYLSVVTQYYTRPEFVFEIPRSAFDPPPEVTSALVTLRLPGERAKLGLDDDARFLSFVKTCFSQKRKTLVNNLRALAKPERVREALASLHLRPDARGEQLVVGKLAGLHASLVPLQKGGIS
jgi:16S rRNA (adenine1518-N6/adenine1519-N6)-dimethyltransferase